MTLYSKAILATNFRTRSNAPFFGVFCVHHDPECYYQERTPNGKLSCVDMQCTSICGNEMIEGKECFPFTIQAKEEGQILGKRNVSCNKTQLKLQLKSTGYSAHDASG